MKTLTTKEAAAALRLAREALDRTPEAAAVRRAQKALDAAYVRFYFPKHKAKAREVAP